MLVINVIEKTDDEKCVSYRKMIDDKYNIDNRFDKDLTYDEKDDFTKYRPIDEVTYNVHMIKTSDFIPNISTSEIKPYIVGTYSGGIAHIALAPKQSSDYILVRDVVKR